MRDIRRKLDGIPEHLGLAYEVWTPDEDNDGKIPDRDRDTWLDDIVVKSQPSADFLARYRIAYQRWVSTLAGLEHRTWIARTQRRLLVGHGQPAPTDVGLRLHHTWGVPVIPGSALAGLLAHFVQTCYGPDRDRRQDDDAERLPYAGPRYAPETGRAVESPGTFYVRLFGAPPVVDGDGVAHPARRGGLIVHDALWIPPDRDRDAQQFLLRDVVTPHHHTYYSEHTSSTAAWPNDHDDPIPISFVTVGPQTRFLIALTCPDADLLDRACRYLGAALASWGIGAKTAAGYGRLEHDKSS
ncbi:MAG: type III-B CRISPR module RAMP protein Cmr6 [Proteobacteria bacterium]|nr:type III-B CRISPR module RAMP protein Cmr6 [Pseudomonadota bacterium]